MPIEPEDIYCRKVQNGTWEIVVGERVVCQVSSEPIARDHVRTLRQTIVNQQIERRDVFPYIECPECHEPCNYEEYNHTIDMYEFFCSNCGEIRLVDTFEWL